jgi:D-glycero-D-manno-heptose 1,7-bisphosphate phosphatase
MQKAVFLDRDGVLNNEESNYYIFRTEDFFLNEGIIKSLQMLRDRGYIFIVITNQGGISKGYYSHEDVKNVHTKLETLLAKENIRLAEIYYCPHHSDNENCLCRKPKALSIEKAIARFNISREHSYFVGDRDTDIEAARKAGLQTVKVKSNQDMSFLGKLIK